MNILVERFPEILRSAAAYGLPTEKKRAILREYLQMMFLDAFYRRSQSAHAAFVGGTALRIIHNLNRFSEDLDFDRIDITTEQFIKLAQDATNDLSQSRIVLEIYKNKTKENTFLEIRYPSILFDLGVSANQSEKLMIKIDNAPAWRSEKRETVLVSRYDFMQYIVTIPLSQILVQKMAAFVGRKQTQSRDMYDILWICARGIKPDKVFMDRNYPGDLTQAVIKNGKEKLTNLKRHMRKIEPYLFDASKAKLLSSFVSIVSGNR